MAEFARRFFNPWVLHIQKLGLELKCPLCLHLFDQPMLLPCDHIFCKSCLDLSLNKLECPICEVACLSSAIRASPHTKNMVFLYKNMDTTLCTMQQSANSGAKLCSEAAVVKCSTSDIMLERLNGSTNTESKYGSYKDKCREIVKSSAKTDEFVNNKGSTAPAKAVGYEERGNLVTEMNLVLQSAPDSPPSPGGPRGDDDSSDQGSEHSRKRCLAIDSPIEKFSEALVDQNRRSQELKCHSRDAKRQKTSLCDLSQSGTESINQQENNSSSSKSFGGPSGKSKINCAFCQSPEVLETTGPMLHYVDGVPVEGDDISRPEVTHVHEKCVNWAPKVYFKGDIVKNLKQEVIRSMKLKCSKCGLKGAALGCYDKSCKKSFHVTCAMELSGCRWDIDDFLLLCPNHASVKFPQEKSHIPKTASVKDFAPVQMSRVSSNSRTSWETGGKQWVFCGSALTIEEKSLMMSLCAKFGIRVTKYWKPDVTHVITSTDANGACCRSLKFLMGISHGVWILKINWIKACLEAQRPVAEEPYEVSIDNHGCVDGPKTGRLRALSNGAKVFTGLRFYFSGYFIPHFKRDLQNLLAAAGGSIIGSAQESSSKADERHETVIVYNLDPLNKGDASDEALVVQQRRDEALDLAKRAGGIAVAHTWLLESIAACKLLP
uniref:Uncharacterized protein n=1 Tax=Kalanchoe fedtschenkoi TaxID=63787 RepID=A0A7N0T7R9_KALFE